MLGQPLRYRDKCLGCQNLVVCISQMAAEMLYDILFSLMDVCLCCCIEAGGCFILRACERKPLQLCLKSDFFCFLYFHIECRF